MNTYFIIQEKSSGKFLPEPVKPRLNQASSYTHTEPTDDPKFRPRLFTNPDTARRALTQWLRGRHEEVYDSDPDYGGRVGVGTIVKEVGSRKKENMEVIEVIIQPLGGL